jgi:hypothetical protein
MNIETKEANTDLDTVKKTEKLDDINLSHPV